MDQLWGALRPLSVDLDEVVAAMDHLDRSETDHFLNLQTGEVITLASALLNAVRSGVPPEDTDLPEWQLDDLPLAEAAVKDEHGESFICIPEGRWVDMQKLRVRFARAIKTEGIREQAATAVYAHDGGEKFAQLLKAYPQLSAAWYRFEARQKRAWAREWLERIGIEVT